MHDLPPDPARLRTILAYLDKQLADEETVVTYLRLQRDTVRQALAHAEGEQPAQPQPQPRPPLPPADPATTPRRPSKPFLLERRRTPDGPLPTAVHTADCHMAGEMTHAVNGVEARLAIEDAGLSVCAFCRPDQQLGLDD